MRQDGSVASCGATYPLPASHVIPGKFRRGGWYGKDARWALGERLRRRGALQGSRVTVIAAPPPPR